MEEQYKNRLKETTGVIFDALPDAYSDSFWASLEMKPLKTESLSTVILS